MFSLVFMRVGPGPLAIVTVGDSVCSTEVGNSAVAGPRTRGNKARCWSSAGGPGRDHSGRDTAVSTALTPPPPNASGRIELLFTVWCGDARLTQ